MRSRYLRLLEGEAARAAQVRAYGRSRPQPPEGPVRGLGEEEAAFIARRDSFYLASAGEGGWPYVQHRGGPRGFLVVLDPATVAFADYGGNRQLLSAGNVVRDPRVSLFLMDYAARERLKLLGRAELLWPGEDPALEARLPVPPGAKAERLYRIRVEGFDWNCPKYITPRYTADEVEEVCAPLRREIAELQEKLATATKALRDRDGPV